MKAYCFFFLITLFCSCSPSSKDALRIGVDPYWYGADFGPQTPYVNGYTEDALFSVAEYGGMRFELMRANSDDLLEGLQTGKYDAILTTLPSYEYHLAKYDFSENLLDIGPVLITPYRASKQELQQFRGDLVGILEGDPVETLVSTYPEVMIRTYPSIPALLGALASGEIEGAVLDVIPAWKYVTDLYQGVLQIAGGPLNKAGVRLVSLKTKELSSFDQHLRSLQKRKKFEELKQKWSLFPGS